MIAGTRNDLRDRLATSGDRAASMPAEVADGNVFSLIRRDDPVQALRQFGAILGRIER